MEPFSNVGDKKIQNFKIRIILVYFSNIREGSHYLYGHGSSRTNDTQQVKK